MALDSVNLFAMIFLILVFTISVNLLFAGGPDVKSMGALTVAAAVATGGAGNIVTSYFCDNIKPSEELDQSS